MVTTEVLLQQTRAGNLARMWNKIFSTLTGWEALRAVENSQLLELIGPLGLGRRRTRTLKALAAAMGDRKDVLPANREDLEALPGVGQYTASAVMTLRDGAAEPLLDVNLARVLTRYFGLRLRADLRDDPFLQLTARQLLEGDDPRTMNWVLLDFAALVCRARAPRCPSCPVFTNCHFRLARPA